MKTLLFYRDFHGFTGGHLKVWDYFRHTKESAIFKASIHLTESSLRDASNPWIANNETICREWQPKNADVLFVAGLDWNAVPEDYEKPIINLVQGLRHANPADPRYPFLSRPATRICVSQEVAEAISSTGKVNGPVLTIPNGLDLTGLPAPAAMRDIPLLIVGYKEPKFAESLENLLRASGMHAMCLTRQLPRLEYLSLLARAAITVFLPNRIEGEGFYLPALEGMALGTLIICPDCVGNRSFCIEHLNCSRPSYDITSIAVSCLSIANAGIDFTAKRISEGFIQVLKHSVANERSSFMNVIQTIIEPTSSP